MYLEGSKPGQVPWKMLATTAVTVLVSNVFDNVRSEKGELGSEITLIGDNGIGDLLKPRSYIVTKRKRKRRKNHTIYSIYIIPPSKFLSSK